MTYTELDAYIARQASRDWQREKQLILRECGPQCPVVMELIEEVYRMGYNTGSLRTTDALQTASN